MLWSLGFQNRELSPSLKATLCLTFSLKGLFMREEQLGWDVAALMMPVQLFLVNFCSQLYWGWGFLWDQPGGFNEPFFQSCAVFNVVPFFKGRIQENLQLFYLVIYYFCPSGSPCVPYILPTACVSACPMEDLCADGYKGTPAISRSQRSVLSWANRSWGIFGAALTPWPLHPPSMLPSFWASPLKQFLSLHAGSFLCSEVVPAHPPRS